MIRKTIFVALFFFIVYSGLIMMLNPSIKTAQDQKQSNIIKAQDFIYGPTDTNSNVIIGSSLACRIAMDSLPGFTNLAFAGESLFDGFTIIAHKKKFPARIFIETNMILRKNDKEFTDELFNPFFYKLKYIPSLRDGWQPVAVTGGAIKILMGNSGNKGIKKKVISDTTTWVFSKMIENEVRNYNKQPDETALEENFKQLDFYIQLAIKNRSTIIFFEMPVNKKLCNLSVPVTIRTHFAKFFPPTDYYYLPMPDCSGYNTTDGLHLDDHESIAYTTFFKNQVDIILNEINRK